MIKKITHAVFPIAGLGTRCLPASKNIPKEMLCIGNKPLIQHIFENVRKAGIEQFIFVTGRNKTIIEDHFDHAFELENHLEKNSKNHLISDLHDMMAQTGQIVYTRQQRPLGLGHAIACARQWIPQDSAFLVVLPDMYFTHETALIRDMINLHQTSGHNIITVKKILPSESEKYGIVKPHTTDSIDKPFSITQAVEKPPFDKAPSLFAISGRYILSTDIFNCIDKIPQGHAGEIQLTDALNELISIQGTYALPHDNKQLFDCGSIEGLMAANVNWIYNNETISQSLKNEYGFSLTQKS